MYKWPLPLTSLTDEYWRVHPEYCDIWTSSLGRVWRSCHLSFSGRGTKHLRFKCGNFLNLFVSIGENTKYLHCSRDGQALAVHRLVCSSFKGLPEFDDLVCHHIDGNGLNNKPENLEWLPTGENTTEGIRRRKRYGEGHPNSKLNDKKVFEICSLLTSGLSVIDIADRYNVSETTIQNIRAKKIWTHLDCVKRLQS